MVRPRWQTFTTTAGGPGFTESCTCEQAKCQKWVGGWKVALDETIPIAAHRARYIRKVNRRPFDETRETTGVTVFTFQPGTPCFCDVRDARGQQVFAVGAHTRQVRQGIHIVSAGHVRDVARQIATRGRPESVARIHRSGDDWAEHAFESYDRMLTTFTR